MDRAERGFLAIALKCGGRLGSLISYLSSCILQVNGSFQTSLHNRNLWFLIPDLRAVTKRISREIELEEEYCELYHQRRAKILLTKLQEAQHWLRSPAI